MPSRDLCLPKQRCQIGSFPMEEVATPGKQAADAQRIGWDLVSTHRAVAFLDPPANHALTGIVGAIQLLLIGTSPCAIAPQPTPQVPAIQKQQPPPRDETRRAEPAYCA